MHGAVQFASVDAICCFSQTSSRAVMSACVLYGVCSWHFNSKLELSAIIDHAVVFVCAYPVHERCALCN